MAGAESWRVSGGRRVRAAPLGLAAPFPSAPALSAASAAVRGLLVGVEALSRAAARLPPLLRARRAARLRPLARRLRRLPRLGEGARHRRAGIAGSGGGEERRGGGKGGAGLGWAACGAGVGTATACVSGGAVRERTSARPGAEEARRGVGAAEQPAARLAPPAAARRGQVAALPAGLCRHCRSSAPRRCPPAQ